MKRIGPYFARRIVSGLLTVAAVVTLTFLMYWSLSPQPGRFVYPNGIKTTRFQLHDGAHRLGADRPKIVQYADWWWHLLHGSFGHMWTGAVLSDNVVTTQPIGPTLYPATRETLSLLVGGLLVTVLLAVPLGVLAGRRVGSRLDRVISTGALIGVCIHPIVVGTLLSRWFGLDLGWLPLGGYCPFLPRSVPAPQPGQPTIYPPGTHLCGGPVDWTTHLILPWITFGLLFLALYTRIIRASVAESIGEDFVRTARAKGQSEYRVIRSHVLPNAWLPVITMVGMDIGTALGVAVFIEASFGFQGLAELAVRTMAGDEVIAATDLPMLLAVVTVVAAIVVVGNLIADVLQAIADPRVSLARPPRRTRNVVTGIG